MLDFLIKALPSSEGWLASWQLFIATTAVFNSVQNFVTLKLTKQIYDQTPVNAPVTPLQARTFAAWTLMSAVIRGYAAYNINNKTIYDMAFMSYLIAFGHFSSEFFIFRTCSFNKGIIGPFIVSTTTLIWMFTQYDFYVRSS